MVNYGNAILMVLLILLQGLGVFHLAMGVTPPSVRSLIELVGFEGDINLGFQELETAFESKCPRAAEAGTGCQVLD